MSEHEKREQIGELVETISHIRDESNHIAEKLNRAFLCLCPNDWQFVTNFNPK